MSGSLSTRLHFDFSALPLVNVREAFARLENGEQAVYAGVQHSSWARDEAVWNSRDGRYGGTAKFGFALGVAHELRLAGATLENLNETDEAARLATGMALRAICGALYGAPPRAQFRLYDDMGGFIEREVGGPQGDTPAQAEFGILAPGSYALWARLGLYLDGDPASNPALNNPEVAWGEWSLLRVQIGNGAWQIPTNAVASPGCPLYRKVGAAEAVVTAHSEIEWRLPFDVAARSVSASCVLERDILTAKDEVDVARGAQIIAGLRASRSGPQSALWVLNVDNTVRLLALSENFSNGFCECGKADHHASDVVQGPDGALYLLSECSLHRYEPSAPLVSERLAPFPHSSDGHPGGQCLRFVGGGQELAHWTENLTQGVDDGASWYNRLVRRVGGRDLKGLSSWWHGPNCAETFLGRFWALRGEPDANNTSGNSTENATIYLDWIDNGRWHGFTGLARPARTHRWQRLRRVGGGLFVFGFAPATTNEAGEVIVPDAPLAAWSDGKVLREVSLPFYVRRATPCELENTASLFITARPAARGMGAATHVVQVSSPGEIPPICSFWNAEAEAFLLSRAAWEDTGHSVNELPAFLKWQAQAGRNGGGVWQAVSVAPLADAYLEKVVTETMVRFEARGVISSRSALQLENGFTLCCEDETVLELEE